MKKLTAVLIIIATIATSCLKETSVDSKDSSLESRAKATYRSYIIRNEAYHSRPDIRHFGVTGNWNGANALMIFEQTYPQTWQIEYMDGPYKKLWSERRATFDRWRLLEVFAGDVGPRNVSIWTNNGGWHQQWEFKGVGNFHSIYHYNGFYGVIVNRKSGRMLRAARASDSQGNPIINVFTASVYKGSPEEKLINEGRVFDIRKDLLWNIYKAR